MNVNTDAIFLARTTCPAGTHIFVTPQGDCETADSGLSLRGFHEDWIYLGRAEGDYDRTDWGIEWDEAQGGYVVRDADQEIVAGPFDDDSEALKAAVEEFGIPAEIHDQILEEVETAKEEKSEPLPYPNER